jgi:hypothetical protein
MKKKIKLDLGEYETVQYLKKIEEISNVIFF